MTGWIFDDYIAPDARLSQGDFIRFDGEDSPLRKFGIVVTADCDLEQRKHARSLTLVPVVPSSTVLEYYLIPEDCEKKRSMIERYVFKQVSIDENQDAETKLALLKQVYTEQGANLDATTRLGTEFILGRISSVSVSDYKNLMEKVKSGPKKLEALKQQLRSRGDLLILPDTSDFAVKAGVAWMRHVWQMPISEVAIRTSEIGDRSGERMARLDSPYRYRLTQLMAQVFSDIGLPNIPDMVDQSLEDAYSDE